jgi:hypothetical protein
MKSKPDKPLRFGYEGDIPSSPHQRGIKAKAQGVFFYNINLSNRLEGYHLINLVVATQVVAPRNVSMPSNKRLVLLSNSNERLLIAQSQFTVPHNAKKLSLASMHS